MKKIEINENVPFISLCRSNLKTLTQEQIDGILPILNEKYFSISEINKINQEIDLRKILKESEKCKTREEILDFINNLNL